MPAFRVRHVCLAAGIVAAFAAARVAFAADTTEEKLHAAVESVTAVELFDHVATLSADAFEGRAVGSRGGYAASRYILEQLRRHRFTPAGTAGDYFQECDHGGHNILAVWPGTDPQLQHEYVVVSAHYDHVGDGSLGHTSGGPVGQIYNGADDNASGVAVLLEMIQALANTPLETRRSILFAFWDGEELGMLGSKHWFTDPTIPTSAVQMEINLDMVGRLRDGRLEVVGSRTGYGFRRLLSRHVDNPLWLDFTWELQANSDHWSFIEHHVPTVMFHTGMHDDYHRPTDDADKINRAGMEQVCRYVLTVAADAADADQLPAFRAVGQSETLAMQKRDLQLEQQAAKSGQWPGAPPRLGIAWRTDDAEPGSVYLTRVAENSPAAAAGLEIDDRIYAVNGQPFADSDAFRSVVVGLLDAGTTDITLLIESRGHLRTATVHWHATTLAAKSGT